MSWVQEEQMGDQSVESIAIIGMTGRFPGANTVEEFWCNLRDGVEGVTFLSKEEDQAIATNPELLENPHYVPAGAFLDGVEKFDAGFFGYNVREAQVIDPQQRLFLECAWEALERAGYDAHQYEGRIGVFAGSGVNQYYIQHVLPHSNLVETVGSFQSMISNEKDYLSTRVSHKLGLTGPSITVQTACSTSLSAITLACQSLLSYQSDLVLAGGVSLLSLEKKGYLYEKGGIASPDGHCRAFDADAQGTIPGNGVGIVVLKRLEDALAEGDQIYAVIKGIAMNNDGDQKIGFTAPSIDGQASVIKEAMELAGVDADSIRYVETHGTGTNLGDPIEIAALTQAFRSSTQQVGSCAIGSVKTNIGHLDTAAGVTGVIKTALALQHKQIPPSLHFQRPNPQIDFANSPFYVNTQLTEWMSLDTPRRAGVSSFGIGGTNVHAVLEEAPARKVSGDSYPAQLISLSAKTSTALEKMTDQLVSYLQQNPQLHLVDVAYTLQIGRRQFPYRRVWVASTMEETIELLQRQDQPKGRSFVQDTGQPTVAFLFPGQGSQYIYMGQDLYQHEPTYRKWIDYCANQLEVYLGLDIRKILYPSTNPEEATQTLQQTRFAQPALFVTEYALAKLLGEWGVHPAAMIGHSLGEFISACLSGVMSLEDALYVVAERGRLMQEMPAGKMIAVPLSEEEIIPYLEKGISLAALNAPASSVVAGPQNLIGQLQQKLLQAGIDSKSLHTSHAFHSPMMEPARIEFRKVMSKIQLHPPQIPFVSCLTGTWITTEEAMSPDYWSDHLRHTVRFAEGAKVLSSIEGILPIEVGPGQTLTSLYQQIQQLTQKPISTMRHPRQPQSDWVSLLEAVGKLWLNGTKIDFAKFYEHQSRSRVLLPTYPFERKKYWIPAAKQNGQSPSLQDSFDFDEDSRAEEDDLYVDARSHLHGEYIAPRTVTEQKVGAIWQEYLGIEKIGVYDNFFELGGHSLLAIRLMRKIREIFQVEIPEHSLYDQSTIAAMSEAIEQSKEGITSLTTISRDQPLPTTWTQQRMWEREKRYPEDSYTTSIGWEFIGPLDVHLFERGVHEMVKRHEALRTHFEEIDGQLFQVIAPSIQVTIPCIDLTHLSGEEQEKELHQRASDEERIPIPMTSLILWRFTLYRLEQERHALFLTAHTSVWDGPSTSKLLTEIRVVLEALKEGKSWSLPELPLQFVDYVHGEQMKFQRELEEYHLNYWREKFTKSIQLLSLPTDRPREDANFDSSYAEFKVPKTVADHIKQLSQERGATFYTGMLAAFQILMHRHTGQDDILIETSFANRNQEELEHVVGSFVNFVLLRTDLSGDPSYENVLERTKETVNGAITHREFPFARVLQKLQPDFYANLKYHFRVSFTQYENIGFMPLPMVRVSRRLWARRALNELYISIVDCGDEGVRIYVEYDAQLFDQKTVVNLIADYNHLLEEIAGNPKLHVSKITLLSDQDCAR